MYIDINGLKNHKHYSPKISESVKVCGLLYLYVIPILHLRCDKKPPGLCILLILKSKGEDVQILDRGAFTFHNLKSF